MSKPNPVTIGAVNVNATLSDAAIANLLVSAREGGSNYWAAFEDIPYTYDADKALPLRLPVDVVEISDDGPEHDIKHTLTAAKIEQGCQLLTTVPHVLCNILRESDDANDADVFLQLCLLGEVKYG